MKAFISRNSTSS